MAAKPKIWMEMKKMALMKVGRGRLHFQLIIDMGCSIFFSVIYPVDFKTKGHIVDDVSASPSLLGKNPKTKALVNA